MNSVSKKSLIVWVVVLLLFNIFLLNKLWQKSKDEMPNVLRPVQVFKNENGIVLEFISNKELLLKENEVNAMLVCYGDENQAEILYNPDITKPDELRSSRLDEYVKEKSKAGHYYYRVPIEFTGDLEYFFYNHTMTCHIHYAGYFGNRYSPVMQISTKPLTKHYSDNTP